MLFQAWVVEYSDQYPENLPRWALQLESFPPRSATPHSGRSYPPSSIIMQVRPGRHSADVWLWAQPEHARPESDPRFAGRRWMGTVDTDSLSRVVDVARRTNVLDGGFEAYNCQTWCVDVLDALCNAGMYAWSAGERAKIVDRVLRGGRGEADEYYQR